MPIPPFEDRSLPDKLLPNGVHSATVEEIEETLSTSFPTSVTRSTIVRKWKLFRSLVRKIVTVQNEYVDGSFVTSRMNPADIDLSMWIRAVDLRGLSGPDQMTLRQLTQQSRAAYSCHLFVVPECPPVDPAYQAFQKMLWVDGCWKTYRDPLKVLRPGVEKGYLEVVL